MKKLFFLVFLIAVGVTSSAQNDLKFGLQTGATMSTFSVDVSISNAIAATVPPINEFSYTANFQVGAWLEKRFAPFIAIRWEVQRSPGGAKAFDVLEHREKRYKYFYLSSPLIFKLTSFQQKLTYPFQLEAGISANFFLFDYGEDITFGAINKLEYSSILGLTKNIDDKWSVSVRYIKGLTPFSGYDAGGIKVNWTNQMYALTFGRSLFVVQKAKEKTTKNNTKKKKAVAKKKRKKIAKKKKRKKKR